MPDVMMDFTIVNKDLILNYDLVTEKCSWSIFDLSGMELCKGTLNGNAPHKIPVACLSPDLYQLCVIDGDQLSKTKFRVS
ncbi:hypothetical protein BH09BAC5_BH09BAC5_17010 [soil metagenome]